MKFKLGDRVRLNRDSWGGTKKGDLGTVVAYKHDPGIEFDKPCGGHDCDGKGKDEHCWWVCESGLDLAEVEEETPKTFKVGDRVKAIADPEGREKAIGVCGTVRDIDGSHFLPILVEFDTHIDGHEGGGKCKDGFGWWCRKESLELINEVKEEEVPAQPITVNITVNINYDNACWYCRKDGIVDRYLAGRLGICPSCGRVCNSHVTKPTEPPKTESPKKENKPLTREELEALPDGAKVFTVWCSSGKGVPTWDKGYTSWRTKNGDCLERKSGHCFVSENGKWFLAYLEEPEKPKGE